MKINDVNDNPPVFGHQIYELSVSEATPVGMTIWQNELENDVYDLDSNQNGHLAFSVIPGDGSAVSRDKIIIKILSNVLIVSNSNIKKTKSEQLKIKSCSTPVGLEPTTSE